MILIDTPTISATVTFGDAQAAKHIEAAKAATALKSDIRTLRDRLGSYAYTLDGVDHDAARRVHEARDALFEAWSKLRAAETLLSPSMLQAA